MATSDDLRPLVTIPTTLHHAHFVVASAVKMIEAASGCRSGPMDVSV